MSVGVGAALLQCTLDYSVSAEVQCGRNYIPEEMKIAHTRIHRSLQYL